MKRCEDFELWLRLFTNKSVKYKCLEMPLTIYNNSNSLKKDNENAFSQLKIRLITIRKLILIIFAISLGIFPNILRLIIGNNFFLRLRRRI